MAREAENTLGLATTLREAGGRALEAGETLPRGLLQLAEDFNRRGFHAGNFVRETGRVKRGHRWLRLRHHAGRELDGDPEFAGNQAREEGVAGAGEVV